AGCELLMPGNCPTGYEQAVREVLAKMRPDIVFFIGFHGYLTDDDPAVTQHVRQFSSFLKANAGVVMVDLPYFLPVPHTHPSYGIAHFLAR
ncbi:hypothetical protein PFISCL1PPCAC_13210, partial [Pristionchus fissidentatus]